MKVNLLMMSRHFVKFHWLATMFYHKLGFHFVRNSFYFYFLILIIFKLLIHYILEIEVSLLRFSLNIVAPVLIILNERLLLDFFIFNLLLGLLEILVNHSNYHFEVLNFLVNYQNRPLKFWFFSANLIDQITSFNESTSLNSVNL
jgi:hypothetical protein